MDVVVEGNKIAAVSGRQCPARTPTRTKAHVLDGTGMYLLPGFINSHVHLQDERAGIPQPFEYEYKIWLSCGITTVRDVGQRREENPRRAAQEPGRAPSSRPRIYIYMVAARRTPEEGRQAVRAIKEQGGDGVKIFGMDRDIMEAIVDESKKLGLKVAHHIGVEETDARDAAAFGVATIEHWYGIPDAALKGSQNFPPSYNYNNESDRFRWAGRLWREADPAKLDAVLTEMVEKGVAWIPTFSTYEACRDMTRARNLPWFKDYLHPALEAYFKPSPARHGAFSWGWSTEDEIAWKENYRIWMKAVRDFADKGGLVGAGDDAGFIYTLYGFTYLSELELLQEAGFHPDRRHPVRHRQQRQAHGARGPAGAGAPGIPGRPHPHRREPAGQPQIPLSDRASSTSRTERTSSAAGSNGRSRTASSTTRRRLMRRSRTWYRRPAPERGRFIILFIPRSSGEMNN